MNPFKRPEDEDKKSFSKPIVSDQRPGAIDPRAQQLDIFPLDAWEFDDPKKVATPVVRLKSPWQFSVQSDIDGLISNIGDMNNKNKITPSEKKEIYRQWQVMIEAKEGIDVGVTQAGISLSNATYLAFSTAHNNLLGYLYTSPGILLDYTVSSTVDYEIFVALWGTWKAKESDIQSMINAWQLINGSENALAGTTIVPIPPILAGNIMFNTAYLRWDSQLNLTGSETMRVERSDVSNFSSHIDVATVSGRSFTEEGLTLNGSDDIPAPRTYYYRIIRIVNGTTESSPSNIISLVAASLSPKAISSSAITNAKIAANAVDMGKMATGIRPPRVVAALPANPYTGYMVGDTVVLTSDNKLYRLTSVSLPTTTGWTSAVPTADLSGTVSEAQIASNAISIGKMASGLRPPRVVSSLPVSPFTGYLAGDTVVLTTDSKLYRFTGTAFTKDVDAVDIVANSITAAQIATGAIATDELAANSVTVDKILIGDFTNLCADPSFELGYAPTWPAQFTLDITIKYDGVKSLKCVNPLAYSAARLSNTFDVVAGEKLYMEWWIYHDSVAASYMALNIDIVNNDGTFSYDNRPSVVGVTVGQWTKQSGVITIAKNGRATIQFKHLQGSTGAYTYHIDKILVKRQTGTTLIEDGAITTNKITVNTLNGDRITAGTLAADKITADSITAGQIAAGAISADEIAADAVTASKIVAGARDMPKFPSAYWSMDDVPETPTDPAGVAYLSDFTAGLNGWSAIQTALTFSEGRLISTVESNDPIIMKTISFSGSIYRTIRVKLRQTAGTSISGRPFKVYYSTSGHGYSDSYNKVIALPTIILGVDYVFDFDMGTLSVGGTDWITNTITEIRLDVPDSGGLAGQVIEFDFIYIGTGAYLTDSLVDNSGNGNHGRIYGATPVAGISGNALAFDGVNDYVNAKEVALTDGLTMSIWIYKNGDFSSMAGSYARIFRAVADYPGIYTEKSTNTLKFKNGPNIDITRCSIPNSLMSNNMWHHIVATRDGTQAKLYLNGFCIDTQACYAALYGAVGVIHIGGTDYWFNGALDEPRIYPYALTEAQIKYLYENKTCQDGIIITDQLVAGCITTDKIFTNAITTDKILSSAITTEKIAAGAITAEKITVSNLSAIVGNLSTITAGVDDIYNYWVLDDYSGRTNPVGTFRIGNAATYLKYDPTAGGTLSLKLTSLLVDSISSKLLGSLYISDLGTVDNLTKPLRIYANGTGTGYININAINAISLDSTTKTMHIFAGGAIKDDTIYFTLTAASGKSILLMGNEDAYLYATQGTTTYTNVVYLGNNGEGVNILGANKAGAISPSSGYKIAVNENIHMNGGYICYAGQYHCVNNGRGSIELGTYAGSLPGYPSDYYPTLRCSSTLYFAVSDNYALYLSSGSGVTTMGLGSNGTLTIAVANYVQIAGSDSRSNTLEINGSPDSGIVLRTSGTIRGYLWASHTEAYIAVGPGSSTNSMFFQGGGVSIGTVGSNGYKLKIADTYALYVLGESYSVGRGVGDSRTDTTFTYNTPIVVPAGVVFVTIFPPGSGSAWNGQVQRLNRAGTAWEKIGDWACSRYDGGVDPDRSYTNLTIKSDGSSVRITSDVALLPTTQISISFYVMM